MRLLLLFSLFALVTHAQHDEYRDALRILATKKSMPDKQKKRRNSLNDPQEDLFLDMLAAAIGEKPEGALGFAKQAVDAGLPFERILAGPRSVLAKMYALPDYKSWAAANSAQLLHGPSLGSVSDSGASFWLRTRDAVEVSVKVGDAIASASTKAADDFTAVLSVEGLKPDSEYRYSLTVAGKKIAVKDASFRTAPTAGKPAKFRFGFGGGAGYTPEYERMWDVIRGEQTRAFLLLGDNVYIDDPEHDITQLYCYYRRQSRPEWRRFAARTSLFSIYDDHDFGTNDCVPGPDIDKPAWKRPVWEVFTQNWANPSYGGGKAQPGCWYDFVQGDLHFIMLDCRYYRDLKGGSMIGPVQKKWLFDTLKSSTGTFKFLVSSVPWSPGVKPGSRDTWDGFDEERNEIFGFLADNKVNGVVLLAADRHRSDVRRIPRENGYPLYEYMSSRLTNRHTHGLMENAKGSEWLLGYNKTPSVGLIDADTTANPPRLDFRILTIDNKVVGRHSLELPALSH
jgi:alkaline phosphatase D